MASVPTDFKRLLLREMWWTVEDSATEGKTPTTLAAVLKEFARSRLGGLTDLQAGQAVTMTSGNGHSVQFASSNVSRLAGDLTPQDIMELSSELLDLYDYVSAEAANTTDALKYAAMLRIVGEPVTESYADFSLVRPFS